MQPIHWRKSTYSGDGSNCVEIAMTPTTIHIRDSKNTEGPFLAFPSFTWASFVSHTASAGSDDRHPRQTEEIPECCDI
ncbi:DUF397 domain-containing protein [Streptomyces canus]|uniref:DUF397 domain-containing protein n=1 Tax=Streptomyces canus TaxID=58343 RepID=UPI00369AE0D9